MEALQARLLLMETNLRNKMSFACIGLSLSAPVKFRQSKKWSQKADLNNLLSSHNPNKLNIIIWCEPKRNSSFATQAFFPATERSDRNKRRGTSDSCHQN